MLFEQLPAPFKNNFYDPSKAKYISCLCCMFAELE